MLDRLKRSEPLGRLLLVTLDWGPGRVALASLLVSSVVFYGFGSLVGYCVRRDETIVRIFDRAEQPIAPFICLLCLPLLGWFFAWQPQRIAATFGFLADTRIWRCPAGAEARVGPTRSERIVSCTQRVISSPLASAVVLVILVPSFLVWHEQADTGYWWYVSSWYYWAAWVPLILLSWYAFGICVLRAVGAAFAVSVKLLSSDVRIDPHHRDGFGGLGWIGTLIVFSHGLPAFVAVSVPFVMSLQPLVEGERATFYSAIVVLWALYALAVPVFFIAPLLLAHWKMLRGRAQELFAIRVQLRGLDRRFRRRPQSPGHLRYIYLLAKHEHTLRHYPTWPFPGLPGSVVVGLYLAGSIASLVSVARTLL